MKTSSTIILSYLDLFSNPVVMGLRAEGGQGIAPKDLDESSRRDINFIA
ncbi:MAG: hypothetical protein ACPIA2_06940 [Mariniblastus sp.]